MTPQREAKHIQRTMRTIAVDAVAPAIAADEAGCGGLLCLVNGEVEFIPAHGGTVESTWDDPLAYALYARWLATQPDRVHSSRESAVAFVRSRMGGGESAGTDS
jgi:hypothetical protein